MERCIKIGGVSKMLLWRTSDGTVFATYDIYALGKAYTVYTVVDGRPKPYAWFDTAGETFCFYERIVSSKERMIPYE